ncbi:MAG: Ppx/GppA family phosphatase [Bacteroidales bacterium]|nr:Ppx/GppA family phosphatase [Bacteroidales bacterium]
MNLKRYAGIDIGSNAVRLIIKDVLPGSSYGNAILKKRVYVRLPLRLGGDVFLYNKIKKEKEKEFIKAIKIYKNLLDFYNITMFRACATSAVRSAENGIEILNKIEKKTGVNIEIISGREEAMLIFETNKHNLPYDATYLSADLGGGSLQLTLFKNDDIICTHSYKIGTVRMLKEKVKQNELKKFENELAEIKNNYNNIKLLGTGGNINQINKLFKSNNVSFVSLKKLYDELNNISVEERMRKYTFRTDRADVIIPALEIYLKIMGIADSEDIYIPGTSLADGIIRELYENDLEKNNT